MKRSVKPSTPGEGCGQAATSSRGYIEYAFGRAEVRQIARTMRTLILEDKHLCNLYSITTNQAAIIALFRVTNRYVGNLPPMPGVFPDYPAPVVRNVGTEREMLTMR
jgi:hypothetical protein